MSAYFLALRDQAANLWIEVETSRLSHASRLQSKTRHERWLRIGAGVGGAIAGIGGSKLTGDLGDIGGWLIVLVGIVPAICAVLSPSKEITKATERAQQLAAMKMEIFDHVERMRVAPSVSVKAVQFIDRKRLDFVASLVGDETDVSSFQAQAQAELGKMNFHRLDYIGAGDAEDIDDTQDASDDIVPFAVGE